MKYLRTTSRPWNAHDLWFGLFTVASFLLFGRYLIALGRLSLEDARYSHILLIPIISASLIYLQRRRVFASPRYSLLRGAPGLFVGAALLVLAQRRLSWLNSIDHLSVVVLAIILLWIAGFVLCYGPLVFRSALFPMLFLLLMIPIPTEALDKIVLELQKGSAIMTYALFKLFGVPVFWQRFKFLLPGVEIEIAEECSGIRSSMALFITSILAGYVFLRSYSMRFFFSLLTVPVVIFKNAVRIVTISSLGVYVDPGFLYGRLHKYGGLPFSLVSLAILLPLLMAMQKLDHERNESVKPAAAVRLASSV
jgi:exosortase